MTSSLSITRGAPKSSGAETSVDGQFPVSTAALERIAQTILGAGMQARRTSPTSRFARRSTRRSPSRVSRPTTRLPALPILRDLRTIRPISIYIIHGRFRLSMQSTSAVPQNRRHLQSIRGSPTAKARRSRAVKPNSSTPIPTVFAAATRARVITSTVPSSVKKTARCNATIGTRLRGRRMKCCPRKKWAGKRDCAQPVA